MTASRTDPPDAVPREVPGDVLYLTMACDVQRHSIPWVIRGWGARASSWLINYGYLRGDTSEAEIWTALGDQVRL